jgi:hypothetical protein
MSLLNTKKIRSISKLSRKADIAYKTAQAMVRYPDRGYNSKSLERVAQALEVEIGQLFENVEEE